MKFSACCVVAVLASLASALSAQVSNNSAQGGSSGQVRSAESSQASSTTQSQASSTTQPGSGASRAGTGDSAPRPQTYTPEQLLGISAPPPSSVNSVTTPSPVQAPQTPLQPNANASQPNEPRGQCAPVTQDAANDSRFPGVSASQFQRAGVSADAFTRPGVSAEQLRVLAPGGSARSCESRRDVILYPEPTRQPRPIPSVGEP